MIFRLNRLLAHMRRRKEVGLATLLVVVLISITGNAATFYLLEGDSQGLGIGDALWYSIVSITTIGYGDLAPDSMGARIGTAIFIVLLGLSAFTAAIGMTVDWLIDLQLKERTGLGRALARDHLLIVNYPSERRVRQVIDEFLGDPRHKDDEIVVITDKVDSLPFDLRNGHFVRGSPLEEETYSRANVGDARQAIVLSPGYDDPSSDSVNASIVSILEHLNPKIRTVVESLNVKHELLFKGSKNASVVHTFQISSNLLVQESQDPGVNRLTLAITSNQMEGNLASTRVSEAPAGPMSYMDVAKVLLNTDVNLVGVLRGEAVHVQFRHIEMIEGDLLVYVSSEALDWPSIRSLLH